jgi:hypothetical protein
LFAFGLAAMLFGLGSARAGCGNSIWIGGDGFAAGRLTCGFSSIIDGPGVG